MMKLTFKKLFSIPFIVFSLTGCPTSGTFTPNIENYTGSDAAIIYLYNDNKREYALVTYMFNVKDNCFEKRNIEQLTTLGTFIRNETPEINRYTIRPNRTYAVRSVSYEVNRASISSRSFIPEPKKIYYINSFSMVIMHDNTTKEFLDRVMYNNAQEIESLPKPKVWDIRNKTCSNFLTGRL